MHIEDSNILVPKYSCLVFGVSKKARIFRHKNIMSECLADKTLVPATQGDFDTLYR